MTRILFISNTPSPYRVDFFNVLGAMPEIDLTAAFLFRPEEHRERERSWFREEYDSFRPVFLDKKIKLPGGHYFHTGMRELLQGTYDEIVFCGYTYLSMMYGMRLLKRRGKSFWLEIDGALVRTENGIRKRIKTACISAADHWFSTGAAPDQYLLQYGAKQEGIVRYPFSSVKAAELARAEDLTPASKAALRQALGLTEEKILVSVGQFIPRKGFDLLLQAAKDLPHDLGIYIIGGEPPKEYTDFVAQSGLDHVHFLKFMDKRTLWRHYLAADLFVLPTREDIWGLVVNEAMACGLPVVTTDNCVAGMEMVEEGENGFLVKAGDAEDLLRGLKLALDSDLRRRGRNALETAKKYTIEQMAQTHWACLHRKTASYEHSV